MSVKLVTKEINNFLKTSTPEVLCIMGKWGVGKTYAWSQYLKIAVDEKRVGLSRYSYVSLFGQNSLEDLKTSIFENTINLDQINTGPTVETLHSSIQSMERGGRFLAFLARNLPRIKEYVPSLFFIVRKQIICIDDLERRGDNLSLKDVLGLISFLKEQRYCKVILILNNEVLAVNDNEDFKNQLEKVADVEIRFEPTPTEAAEIGLDKVAPFYDALAKICVVLEIVNIRVMRRFQRLAYGLYELLNGHNKKIFESALPSLVLFAWSFYQPKEAPSENFLKVFNRFGHLFEKDKKESGDEKRWRLIISATGYTIFDEFDQLILDSVKRGYFDADLIEAKAVDLDRQFQSQDQDVSFGEAWEKYHNSFACDETEVLDGMFAAFKKNVKSISPTNADGTIALFRKFNRDKQAEEMITCYMNERNEKRDFYDPRRSVFLEIKDPGLSRAFAEKLNSFKDIRTPEEILINIAKTNGWNPEDISTLARVTVDGYYNLFKGAPKDILRIIVSQSLKFKQYNTSDKDMGIISERSEEALKRIGRECLINKERVSLYGVSIDEEKSAE